MSAIALPSFLGLGTGCLTGILVLLTGMDSGCIAFAQVTADGTLSTTVTPTGNNFAIDQGDRSGNNLFHSFREFSVPTGGSAVFNNAVDIQTIFSRVTGGSVSNIDGLIQANGTANLFLLNPNGILFGPNASLNIGGSFMGTTATSIKFADGTEFSAVNTTGTPLLTVSVPVGLQMGINAGDIRVESSGNTIARFGPSLLNPGTYTTGLSVTPGNTLSLIGGNVNLVGGLLFAASGKVELGAFSNGIWNLRENQEFSTVGATASTQFGTLQLSRGALINVSGLPAGAVNLQGGQIRLQDGATVISQNLGTLSSGNIQVNARDRLELSGFNATVSSRIVTQSLSSGSGSNISIVSPQIKLESGGAILAQAFGTGSSGAITIQALDFLELSSFSPANPFDLSAISTASFSSGAASNLTVVTDRLLIREGGQIAVPNLGSSKGGLLTVTATDSIDIAGASPASPSAIVVNSFGSGDAGSIIINTSTLKLSDVGGVSSSSFSSGNGGSILINARNRVEIDGDFEIDGGVRSSVTAAPLVLRVLFGLTETPTGNSGSIRINTPELVMSRSGSINVENQGSGNSDAIEIYANSIKLNNQGRISAFTNSGNGGDITLQTQKLLSLRHGSFITTASAGEGNGGNIIINSPIILGLENSDIIANAVGGRGGSINITTQDIIGLGFRNTLTPRTDLTNDITAGSEFSVSGTVQINNIGIDPNSGLINLPADLADASQQIAEGCAANQGSSFVITGRGGLPQNPMTQTSSDRPWSDTRDLSSYRSRQATYAPQSTIPSPLVEATGWRRNAKGEVEVYVAMGTPPTSMAVTCVPWTP